MFTDVTMGERYETDILVRVRFAKRDAYFLIHTENQASPDTNFNQRMFRYFSRLHEKFNLPIYPIVIFSYDRPQKGVWSKVVVTHRRVVIRRQESEENL